MKTNLPAALKISFVLLFLNIVTISTVFSQSHVIKDTTCSGGGPTKFSTYCGYYYTAFYAGDTSDTLTYQWQVNTGSGFVNIYDTDYYYEGCYIDSLFILVPPAPPTSYNDQFRCIITGTTYTDTSDTFILIVADPTITGQPEPYLMTCDSTNAIFSIAAIGNTTLTYQWQISRDGDFIYSNISNGTIYSGTTTPSLTLINVQDSLSGYYYRCNVSSSCLVVTSDVSAIDVIDSTPVILTNLPMADTICAASNLTLVVTACGWRTLTYQWQANGISISDSGIYSGTATNALTITGIPATLNGSFYDCMVSNDYGTTNTWNCFLTVDSLVSVSASHSSICYGSSSILTASGSPMYTWSPSTGLNVTTGSSVIASPTATTTYTVTGTNISGCNAATVVVTVYPQLVAYSGGNKSICASGADTLGAHPSASGGISPYTYSWFNEGGDSIFSTFPNPVITVAYPNIYTLTVTDSVGCVVRDAALLTFFTVSAGIPDTILYGASDTLGSTSITAGGHSPFTYSWSSRPTGFTSTSANPVASPTVTTTYRLAVTDSTGCVATDSVTTSVINISGIITLSTPTDSMQTYSVISSTDTVKWFKFTADSSNVTITIPGDSASMHITSLSLVCTACPGYGSLAVLHKNNGSIKTVSVNSNALTTGLVYYIMVTQPNGSNSSYNIEYNAGSPECPWPPQYNLNGTGAPFDSTGWVVIFDDEFANDTAFRKDYWSKVDYRTYWKGGGATQSDSNDVELANGHLRLLQAKIPNPANYIRDTTVNLTNDTTIYADSATAGEITTRRHNTTASVTFLPNFYVESEVWLNFSNQQETNPSVWMWNAAGCIDSFRYYHEVDNFEFDYLGDYFNNISMHLWWSPNCSCPPGYVDAEYSLYPAPSNITSSFYNWGMLYTPDSIGWYFNHQNIKTDTTRAHIIPGNYFIDADDAIEWPTLSGTPPAINYTTMQNSWMDLSFIKVLTDTIPFVLAPPDSMCQNVAVELKALSYPGVNYSWGNGSRGCCVFLYSTSEYGTYTTALNGNATNDAHDVWMKFNTGIAANQAYPLSATLNGLDNTSLTETFNVYVDSIPNVTVYAPVTLPGEYPGVIYSCICYHPTLTASGASSYTWWPSGTLSASTGSSVNASPTEVTAYTVTGDGCEVAGHDTAKIVVRPTCFYDPTFVCLDCDFCLDGGELLKENADTTITILSATNYLKIYPNPNNGAFAIQLSTDSSNTTVQIQLFNIVGQLVYKQNRATTNGFLQQQIQTPAIANGLYLVRVCAGQAIFRQTVIINKN